MTQSEETQALKRIQTGLNRLSKELEAEKAKEIPVKPSHSWTPADAERIQRRLEEKHAFYKEWVDWVNYSLRYVENMIMNSPDPMLKQKLTELYLIKEGLLKREAQVRFTEMRLAQRFSTH